MIGILRILCLQGYSRTLPGALGTACRTLSKSVSGNAAVVREGLSVSATVGRIERRAGVSSEVRDASSWCLAAQFCGAIRSRLSAERRASPNPFRGSKCSTSSSPGDDKYRDATIVSIHETVEVAYAELDRIGEKLHQDDAPEGTLEIYVVDDCRQPVPRPGAH